MNLERYSRQLLYPNIGVEGQQRLRAGKVVLIGCGALGTHIANALVRAGIGRLVIADRDAVELNNLHRLVLLDEDDVRLALPKAEAARRKLQTINSEVQVEAVVTDVHAGNIERLIAGSDLILDGTDNFETRYLINDAAIKHDIPWVYGACIASQGLVMPILPGDTPCLRCVFETMPPPGASPTCDTAGIISPVVQVVSALQVTEAIKILSGHREAVVRRLLSVEVWENAFRAFDVQSDRNSVDCPACKRGRFEFLSADAGSRWVTLCGRNAFQVRPAGDLQVDLEQLKSRLASVGKVTGSEFLLRFVAENCRITLFADGRAILYGAADEATAKSLYAKYVGL